MSKADFLRLLERALAQLSEEERQKNLEYYSELLDDMMEEGMTEAEATAKLGSPGQIAQSILQEMPLGKLVSTRMKPKSGWTPLAIVLAGLIAAVYGVIAWRRQEGFGMYFTLLGLAVVFLFSGTQVSPTMRNNKRAVAAAWEQAQKDVAGVLPEHFPLPARYAHPVVLDRMIRVLREGRAQSAEEALAVVKADLKALNADVQVSQEEYDEVVAIKPMFLVSNYE